MVRSIHKTNIFAVLAFAVLATTGTTILSINNAVHASDSGNVTFNVSVTEMLTVELSTPTTWAEGDLNTLLVNKVNVAAKTNNTVGALVSMYANDTMLKNKTNYSSSAANTYIDSITAPVTVANFNNDAWGYSEDNATYNAIPTSTNPVALFASVGAGTRTDQDVYFGAKSTGAKDSGTYAQTVNFVAVTGTVDTSETPVVPSPSETSTDVIANNSATYNSTSNQTSYTTRSTSGSGISSTTGEKKTTSTQVTSGDTTSSYASAAGVTTTSTGVNGASVATALAVAATVAAISGTIFFVAAKKRREDDEEEEE